MEDNITASEKFMGGKVVELFGRPSNREKHL
jgi:hypothetical protein